jgi:hypothetical protein
LWNVTEIRDARVNYTISIPVFGDWHTWTLLNYALPSHLAAGVEGRYIIHTDRPNVIAAYSGMDKLRERCDVEFRAADMDGYLGFSRDCLRAFLESECCFFLLPDLVIGSQSFEAAKKAIEGGKKMVACTGVRTVSDMESFPPFDNEGLARWSIEHMHPVGKRLFFGAESWLSASNVYFGEGAHVWARCYHLHPFAAVNDGRPMSFKGTIDDDFVDRFKPEEIWVATNREVVFAEITHPSKFKEREKGGGITMDVPYIAACLRKRARPVHKFFFSHRISLSGTPDDSFEWVPQAALSFKEGDPTPVHRTALRGA